MKDLKILVADDHPLVLKGLVAEFKENGYMNFETATNGVEALQYISDNTPDVALLDIDMPYLSGLEVAERAKDFTTKIIILTHHKEEGLLLKIRSINAHAYLLKEDDFSEIENALEAIFKNRFYASSSFDKSFLETLEKKIKLFKSLSDSEVKVMRLLLEDKNTNQIAKYLNVSYRTVEKHRSNIIQKLSLPQQRDALKNYVLENKLIIEEL